MPLLTGSVGGVRMGTGETEATYVPRRNICHVLARYFVSQRDVDINRLLVTIFVFDTGLWVTVDNEFNHGRVDDALSKARVTPIKRFSPLYR